MGEFIEMNKMQLLKKLSYPGSGWALGFRSGNKWNKTFNGWIKSNGPTVTSETLFDLASLTKVVGTLPSCFVLMQEGSLKLEKPINYYISNAGWFKNPSLGDVEIYNLLAHSSGLPAWKPLFSISNISSVLHANVLQTEISNQGKRLYSDLGWIILGHLIERISSMSLDKFIHENVLKPLGMNRTFFNPISHNEELNCAVTEDCGWRKKILQGIVHDENAFAFGGIAGHAGLFSSLKDMITYMESWMNDLEIIGLQNQARMVTQYVQSSSGLPSYGLGWRVFPSLEFSATGNIEGSLGHTGYTGTSLWINCHNQQSIILLNNGVYPTRFVKEKSINKFREEIHQLCLD